MIWTYFQESAGTKCVTNCVMATIYATIVHVVQWNTRDLDGILHTGNRLYMKIPKTYEYLLITDIGNTITEYGHSYKIKICKEVFGIFTEEVDTVINMKSSDLIKHTTRENEWTYGILYIGHLANTSACTLVIQKDDYYIFHLHSKINIIDKLMEVLLYCYILIHMKNVPIWDILAMICIVTIFILL